MGEQSKPKIFALTTPTSLLSTRHTTRLTTSPTIALQINRLSPTTRLTKSRLYKQQLGGWSGLTEHGSLSQCLGEKQAAPLGIAV